MRLWHESLIGDLSRQHLLAQHRECCALRGNGWGKKHSTVDYIFKYDPIFLFIYHEKVMNEMKERGYNVSPEWRVNTYRGKTCKSWSIEELFGDSILGVCSQYEEHNIDYLEFCISHLKSKNPEFYSSLKEPVKI